MDFGDVKGLTEAEMDLGNSLFGTTKVFSVTSKFAGVWDGSADDPGPLKVKELGTDFESFRDDSRLLPVAFLLAFTFMSFVWLSLSSLLPGTEKCKDINK